MAIRLSDMMKGTLNCARNACPIVSGESVLLIADTTTDSLIVDAYRIAYESEGGYVSVMTIPAAGAGCQLTGNHQQYTLRTISGSFNRSNEGS